MKGKFLLLLAAAMAALLVRTAPVSAQDQNYDGLTPLGVGHHFVDEGGATLDVLAFKTKAGEKVVGMYFTSGRKSVHFYMNAATWDKLKQKLVRARDEFAALDSRQFEGAGKVGGYGIAGKRAVLGLGLQGATSLQPKQLLLISSSSATPDQQIVISLMNQQLKDLVEDFSDVDQLLRTP